jgi:hypothetical protein
MSRRIITLLAIAVLLAGALLAWALPALARTRHSGAREVAARSVVARAAVARTAPPRTTTRARTAAGTATTAAQPKPKPRPRPGASAGPTMPRSWVGSWSRPFEVTAPVASDLISPVLAVSATGQLAVGSGLTDEDAPNHARAEVITALPSGAVTPRRTLSGVQQTLAAAYLGNQLVLVTGTSPAADACCSSASTLAVRGLGFGASEPLAAGLEGASTAALVPVRGGLLAAVDNQAGITVARSNESVGFSAGEQLTGGDPTPPLMAAGSLVDGGAVVAWTAPAASAQTVTGTTTAPGSSTTAAGYDQPRNELIYFATAGPVGLPGAPRLAITVPRGRQIDALTVAAHGDGATVAWTESWYAGTLYRSEVFWADLGNSAQGQALSGGATAAVGLSMAGSARGRQVLTWQACDVSAGTCTADAALRPHGDAWGPVRSLGTVDPTSFPVATQSSLGQSLVGWVDNGRVRVRAAKPGATRFYRPVTVARGAADSALSLGFGAGERADAVWIQGTVDQKLEGARFTP